LSNREIADRLFITEQTVKDHLHDVFNHLKITRRSELTVKVLALCPETSVAGEK
jgi:DNA-binding NarL/FixJ family response regulator